MSAHQPGTLAVATVRGVPNVRVFRWTDVYGRLRWDSATLVGNECTHLDEQVTDIRPLVVIDPEDRAATMQLAEALFVAGLVIEGAAQKSSTDVGSEYRAGMADRVADALREFANPTPPKPDEPTGLGAVVEDADGRIFVRWSPGTGCVWLTEGTDKAQFEDYHCINAVRVLSEGVTA